MTLHNKLDTLIELLSGYVADNSHIWKAGYCYGFTNLIIKMNNNEGFSTSIQYSVDCAQISVSRARYQWSNGSVMLTNSIDLSKYSRIQMCYDCSNSWNSDSHGVFGLGVSKTQSLAIGADVTKLEKSYTIPFMKSSTNAIIELDVSNLSGIYWLYIPMITSNSGELNGGSNGCSVKIKYIKGIV